MPTKDTVVLLNNTLLPQTCTKLNTEEQNAQGHLGSKLTPEGENRYFRKTAITNSTKRLSPTAQNHYADLEDTCRDKVTNVGVIVRYIKNVIEEKRRLGSYLTPGGRLRIKKASSNNGGSI